MTSTLSYRLPLLLTTCGAALLLSLSCGDPEPEGPECTTDAMCGATEICSDAGECVVEESLCDSSADCEKEAEFCVPRDDSGGKDVCQRVVRCNRVSEADVSALCRFSTNLKGDEQFTCDVSRPDAPTCVRDDSKDAPCSTRAECTNPGEYCLLNAGPKGFNACGVPRTCDEIITGERKVFCEALEPNSTCDPISPVRQGCKPPIAPPSGDYSWIQIKDLSSGDEACNQTDPGSDIMGVRLLSNSGEILAWGSAGADMQGTSGDKDNRYSLTTRLDGEAHGFSNSSCPAPDTVLSELMPPPYSTGCGGWVLIMFEDEFQVPISLETGMRIEVLEYGLMCGGKDNDLYTINLCTSTSGARQGDASSCKFALSAQQEGLSSVQITELP